MGNSIHYSNKSSSDLGVDLFFWDTRRIKKTGMKVVMNDEIKYA